MPVRNVSISESKFREMLVKQTKPFAEQPLTYQSVLPMNKLWNGYMKDLLEQEYHCAIDSERMRIACCRKF